MRKSGLLGQHGEERGGGGGGVELHLHSREHWAVANRCQQTDFKVELFLGVCFEEDFLRSDGGAAEQLVLGEVQGWGSGGGEGGSSSRS